ncbi:MAG: hypothetical protein MJZ64_08155 [Paludibacteraceae bacterium]|nr:hypothetical protein [Paludibacteraceae bacterium]
MADVILMYPVEEIRGKVFAGDDVYFRKQNGKVRIVRLKNPRTEFSAHEKEVRTSFGALSKKASTIAKDATLAAPYMPGFEAQKGNEKGTKVLYRYILSQLQKEKE